MNKIKFLAASAILVAGLSYSNAQADRMLDGRYTATSSNFIYNASSANMFEIEASKLALKKSTNPEVRAYAAQLINDHERSDRRLASALKYAHVDDYQVPPTLSPLHTEMLEDLRAQQSGPNFDNLYISYQQQAHKDAVNLFYEYSMNGSDSSLKNYAVKQLPTLRDHKVRADSMVAY